MWPCLKSLLLQALLQTSSHVYCISCVRYSKIFILCYTEENSFKHVKVVNKSCETALTSSNSCKYFQESMIRLPTTVLECQYQCATVMKLQMRAQQIHAAYKHCRSEGSSALDTLVFHLSMGQLQRQALVQSKLISTFSIWGPPAPVYMRLSC